MRSLTSHPQIRPAELVDFRAAIWLVFTPPLTEVAGGQICNTDGELLVLMDERFEELKGLGQTPVFHEPLLTQLWLTYAEGSPNGHFDKGMFYGGLVELLAGAGASRTGAEDAFMPCYTSSYSLLWAANPDAVIEKARFNLMVSLGLAEVS